VSGRGGRGAGLLAPAVSVGAATLVLYALTTSPYVLNEDIAEFQTIGSTGGIAHSGYPTHVWALQAVHMLPLSTPAFRANLLSGIAMAVAVALLFAIAARATGNRTAAALAAAAFATSHSAWHEATRAEIYGFTLALCAGVAFLLVPTDRPTDRPTARGVPLASGLLLGLALTSHLSSLALVGVAAAAMIGGAVRGSVPRSAPVTFALGLAAGLLPLASLPFADVHGQPMNYLDHAFDAYSKTPLPWAADLGTRLRRVGLLLSGAQYIGDWFHPFQDSAYRLGRLGLHLVLNDLNLLVLLAAGLGLGVAALQRRTGDVFLLAWLAGVAALLLAAAYPYVVTSFFLPGTWILALFSARGLAVVLPRMPWIAPLVAASLALTPLLRLGVPAFAQPPSSRPSIAETWSAWPIEWSPLRHDASWDAYGRRVFECLPPRAEVFSCWEEGTTLLYLRWAAAVRTDVSIHLSCDSEPRVAQLIADARTARRPVFTTIDPRRLGNRWHWERVAEWPRGSLWMLAAPVDEP
jgi:Protein of unknown function (DUF2723)